MILKLCEIPNWGYCGLLIKDWKVKKILLPMDTSSLKKLLSSRVYKYEYIEYIEIEDKKCGLCYDFFHSYFNFCKITCLPVDKSIFTEFELKVLETLKKTTVCGEVITYKELSSRVGNIHAARAVGNVLAKNPYPIYYPCHRVIKTNGEIGNFSGGKLLKEKLINFERSAYVK